MARNGHPRVPRKIRGERRRMERLSKQGLAAWERELLGQRRRAIQARRKQAVEVRKAGHILPFVTDIYGPMINAQLQAPLSLPTPMSKRG